MTVSTMATRVSRREVLLSHSEEETRRIASAFSNDLQPGDVVALYGQLGTGKTRFVQGIGEGLGITHHITSPSFTLIHEYRGGRLPLFHFDLYRIEDVSEFSETGYEEYLYDDGVTCIEWAERMEGLLPDGTKSITVPCTHRFFRVVMEYGESESERFITIEEISC
ncbi:MAG: tRNA (adenosine(37)-N6)-threonylcarbamoyltransferase complex ATPase subunit type 1 TsaE [Bacteroidota bacterium]